MFSINSLINNNSESLEKFFKPIAAIFSSPKDADFIAQIAGIEDKEKVKNQFLSVLNEGTLNPSLGSLSKDTQMEFAPIARTIEFIEKIGVKDKKFIKDFIYSYSKRPKAFPKIVETFGYDQKALEDTEVLLSSLVEAFEKEDKDNVLQKDFNLSKRLKDFLSQITHGGFAVPYYIFYYSYLNKSVQKKLSKQEVKNNKEDFTAAWNLYTDMLSYQVLKALKEKELGVRNPLTEKEAEEYHQAIARFLIFTKERYWGNMCIRSPEPLYKTK